MIKYMTYLKKNIIWIFFKKDLIKYCSQYDCNLKNVPIFVAHLVVITNAAIVAQWIK